jgi:sodium transport system ATP-binding protein
LIEIDNVAKAFGRRRDVRAVDGVSFAAADGEITGLLGPNGAGKTTLLRMLATLMIPDSGSARVDGDDVVSERYAVRRRIGVLSDARGLYPRLDRAGKHPLLRRAAGTFRCNARRARRRADRARSESPTSRNAARTGFRRASE